MYFIKHEDEDVRHKAMMGLGMWRYFHGWWLFPFPCYCFCNFETRYHHYFVELHRSRFTRCETLRADVGEGTTGAVQHVSDQYGCLRETVLSGPQEHTDLPHRGGGAHDQG